MTIERVRLARGRPGRPLPPQPSADRHCAEHSWEGDRPMPSTGWRWYGALSAWEPVCDGCTGGPGPLRRGDYVPDGAARVRGSGETGDGLTDVLGDLARAVQRNHGEMAGGHEHLG